MFTFGAFLLSSHVLIAVADGVPNIDRMLLPQLKATLIAVWGMSRALVMNLPKTGHNFPTPRGRAAFERPPITHPAMLKCLHAFLWRGTPKVCPRKRCRAPVNSVGSRQPSPQGYALSSQPEIGATVHAVRLIEAD
jgi:hypothetical protein